jgi:uncharacterized protein DUF3592
MKVLKLVSWVFSVVGVGMLIAAILLFSSTRRFITSANAAQGTVIDLVRSRSSSSSSGTYQPVVEFTGAGGQHVEFTSAVGSNPPAYRVGAAVTVLYDPDRPTHARISSFLSLWFGSILLLSLGIIFAAIGLTMIGLRARRREQVLWLTQHGKRIKTDITGVELNESLTVNGRCPYHIVSQLSDPATNSIRVYHSDNIWFDPSDYVKNRSVDVLVDPRNPTRYVMDTSFLPKLVE